MNGGVLAGGVLAETLNKSLSTTDYEAEMISLSALANDSGTMTACKYLTQPAACCVPLDRDEKPQRPTFQLVAGIYGSEISISSSITFG